MPREARVVCANYPYHVTQRGNYRQVVFEDEEDKAVYLRFFIEYKEKFQVKVYAYCLMDNHVHFIVEPTTENGLALLFSRTHMRYSIYFNQKKGARGQLWQGRFYSCPLDKEHLYEAIRYVELNPIRAGITNKIDSYDWSSLKFHLSEKGELHIDSVDEYLQIDNWKTYITEKADEEKIKTIRERTKTNRPAGSEKFIQNIQILSGKTFNFNPKGRPKILKNEIK